MIIKADEELAQRIEMEPSGSSPVKSGDVTGSVDPVMEATAGNSEHCETDSEAITPALDDSIKSVVTKIEDDDMDLEHFLEEAGDSYKLCEFHSSEMLEKNIICMTCQTLMCALCLRDYHLSHEIISVGKLKDCRIIRDSMDNEIHRLQLMHKSMVQQYQERSELKQTIEISMESLLMKVDTAFEQLANIVLAKHKEIRNHIQEFSKLHTHRLKNDLAKLTEMEGKSADVIKKMLSIFTKSGYQQASELPAQLKSVLAKCVTDSVSEIEDKEKYIPETKFSKILPSLQAVANICQTIHPEATKVVWSKVTPDKRKQMSPGFECKKVRLNDSQSSDSHDLTTSQVPESSQESLDSENFIPDSSTTVEKEKEGNSQSSPKPAFKLLKFDINSMEQSSTSHCVLLDGPCVDGNQLAKVCDVSRLSEGWMRVKWLVGRIGCSKYFYLDKKREDELISTNRVLCYFVFPFLSQELHIALEQELMMVINTKYPKSQRKGRARKSAHKDST